ncbi:MAG: tgt [Proteobacteria bacterium]|nr:tgt [Pseudomonadota bacterium]
MTQPFSFRLLATDGRARRGEIVTPHGIVRTPAFMPVGTGPAPSGWRRLVACTSSPLGAAPS